MKQPLTPHVGWDLVDILRDRGEEGFSGVVEVRVPSGRARLFFNQGALVLVRSDDVRLSYAAYLLRSRYMDRMELEPRLQEAKASLVSLEDVLLTKDHLDERTLARHKTELGMDILERLYPEDHMQIGWAEVDPAPAELEVRPVLYLAAFFKSVQMRADPEKLEISLRGREDFRLHASELRAGFFDLFDRVFDSGNPPPYLDGSVQVGELIEGSDGERILREIFALTRLRMAWFHRVEPPHVDPKVSIRVWEDVFGQFGKAV
jgi:hypothetical protein